MDTLKTKAIVIGGSPAFDRAIVPHLPPEIWRQATVIAVDKGLEFAQEFQIRVDIIIGDFDSVDRDLFNHYPEAQILEYPPQKDLSDAEIAIDYALEHGLGTVFCLNMIGGRLDHDLFNRLLLLKAPGRIWLLSSHGNMVALGPEHGYQIELPPQATFSLIPLGPCRSVSVSGCHYPLENVGLTPSTLTLSNVATGPVSLTFGAGALLFYSTAFFSL